MKRCLILVTSFMLLLAVSAFAASDVTVHVNNPDDIVYIGESNIIGFYFQNDVALVGMSVGFSFDNSAGGGFSFDNTWGNTNNTGGPYLQATGDAVGAFDLGGTIVNGVLLPDSIAWGGAALSVPLPAHATSTLLYSLKMDEDNSNTDTPGGFCIDNNLVGPANWEFDLQGGGMEAPTFQGAANTDVNTPDAPAVCFDVMLRPCLPPVFTATPNASVNKNHCLTYSFDFDATEGGNNPSADPVTFSASAGNINSATGEFSIDGPADCSGPTDVTVTAHNACGGSADFPFSINWTNNDPTITNCPTPIQVGKGNAVDRDLNATDPDPCDALTWSVSAVETVVNAPTIDGTGNFHWLSDDTEGGSTFHFVVTVTDPCGGSASCTIEITVLNTQPFVIRIEKTHNSFQGLYEYVSITKDFGSEMMGGYDFLVGYDASALSFISASLGAAVGPSGLGWEYFTYRYGAFGNCGGPCPSGKLRVVAVADQNNGANHPSGFAVPDGGELASLKFYVTNDYSFDCMYVPIFFCWLDCGDNGISSVTGDTLFISDQVYTFENTDPINNPTQYNITDLTCYPFSMGGACSDCDVSYKYTPVRFILFVDGGVDIVCKDSIDARGDLNLNGLKNEIADAVLYTNYFLYGSSALDTNPTYRAAQIAASDVNNDGNTLTVGDLVYLLRVIVGDALPYPKLAPFASTADVTMANGTLSTDAAVNIGAVYATFNVHGAYDVVSNTDMDVLSAENDGQLKVLVYSGTTDMSKSIEAGTSDLFTVNGNVDLVDVQVADYNGNMLNTHINKSVLPTSFALHQNVPNPFNPTTKIGLDLPTASNWSIDIYNVAGQKVTSFSGNNVGTVSVEWDASNVASGIYFYKATVGDWTQTKKMVLMK